MARYTEYTRTRLKLLAERVREKVYEATHPLDELLVSGPVDRIDWAPAQRLDYRTAPLGEELGPEWATFWYKARVKVPDAWAGERVDLLWVTHSEATLWVDARPAQGLNYEPAPSGYSWFGSRPDARLTERALGGTGLRVPDRGRL